MTQSWGYGKDALALGYCSYKEELRNILRDFSNVMAVVLLSNRYGKFQL